MSDSITLELTRIGKPTPWAVCAGCGAAPTYLIRDTWLSGPGPAAILACDAHVGDLAGNLAKAATRPAVPA